jgi:peptide deformylase
MKKNFLKPNNPRLRRVAEEIPRDQINSAATKKIIETMLKVAYGEQKDQSKPVMVGLAAPQIGITKRIILVDVKANAKGKVGDPRLYINPKIIWKSKEKGEWYEGCYSTGRICGIISRSITIKVQAANLKTPEKWTGYIARIFQHEIDHLDGKLFHDHIKNPDHLHWVEENEFPLYRNKEAWRNWPKKVNVP